MAIPVIGACGYYGFSLSGLANACGITVPGVLHHFGSKQGILLALLKHLERLNFDAVWQGVPVFDGEKLAALDLPQVKRLLRDSVVQSARKPEVTRLLSMLRTEALFPQHPAHEFFVERNQRSLVAVTQMLTGKVAAPQDAASQVIALMLGLETLWLGSRGLVDLVELWDVSIDKLLDCGQAGMGEV